MSILFAATYPERVQSLVLYGTLPRFTPELPDYPWGFDAERSAKYQNEVVTHWGEGALAEAFFGPIADVPGFRDLYGRLQRSSASPRMALMLWQALAEIDVRPVLETVLTPTLVLGRRGDEVAPPEAAMSLAAAMPNAEFRELPPGPHGLFDDAMASEILDFVCGTEHEPQSERVLSAVLFTDIVSSTERLSARGDAHWRHELDVHDRLVDRLLSKFGGRRAKHTGDGIFALFDGPTKAARCGLELVPALAGMGMHVRVGVHIGECERRGEEWSGTAVHVGAQDRRDGASGRGAGQPHGARFVGGFGLAFRKPRRSSAQGVRRRDRSIPGYQTQGRCVSNGLTGIDAGNHTQRDAGITQARTRTTLGDGAVVLDRSRPAGLPAAAAVVHPRRGAGRRSRPVRARSAPGAVCLLRAALPRFRGCRSSLGVEPGAVGGARPARGDLPRRSPERRW